MERKTFSISTVIGEGWELAKKYGLLLACMVLIFGLITDLIQLPFSAPSSEVIEQYTRALQHQDWEGAARAVNGMRTGVGYYVASFFASILGIVFYAGLAKTCIMLANGQLSKVNLDGFKMPIATYLKLILLNFITGIIVLIGLLFCIIPGIWLGVKLSMCQYYMLDHPEAGIGDSIKASWEMTKGNFWNLIGLEIANFFIILLGLCMCCIGVSFAIPWSYFNEVEAYTTLVENYIPEAQYEKL